MRARRGMVPIQQVTKSRNKCSVSASSSGAVVYCELRRSTRMRAAHSSQELTSRRMVARRTSRLAQRFRTASRRLQVHAASPSKRRAALPLAARSRLAAQSFR